MIGAIGWATNQGLGTLTQMFSEHIGFEKLLLVKSPYKSFPERFPAARTELSSANIDWLLTGIRTLLMFETPTDWSIVAKAKKRGIKTVLIPMYECSPAKFSILPDLILCPSLLDFDVFRNEDCQVKYLPIPVDRKRIPFKHRKRAKVFQFNGGHGGLYARNGLTELLAAIPMLKSDAKVIINTQKQLDFVHPKCEIRVGNVKDYSDMWGEGDVFVFPHKFDGLSLPIQEALSNGMPVLSTRIYPFTKWLPNEWFFDYSDILSLKVFNRMIDVAVVAPEAIAAKIDEWYDRDLTKDSALADSLASKISWKELVQSYKKILL